MIDLIDKWKEGGTKILVRDAVIQADFCYCTCIGPDMKGLRSIINFEKKMVTFMIFARPHYPNRVKGYSHLLLCEAPNRSSNAKTAQNSKMLRTDRHGKVQSCMSATKNFSEDEILRVISHGKEFLQDQWTYQQLDQYQYQYQ